MRAPGVGHNFDDSAGTAAGGADEDRSTGRIVGVAANSAACGGAGSSGIRGVGNKLLARVLREAGLEAGTPLRARNILNKSTRDAFQKGAEAASTKIGRTLERALNELGLKADNLRFLEERGTLDILVDVVRE